MIIIIHFGEHVLKRFCEVVQETTICGLDAQFVNNCLRRPLYIICSQDPVTFKTIPGFLILLGKNDVDHLHEALEHVKSFILSKYKILEYFLSTFMIDQCSTERKAVENIGCRTLLCEFHVQKTINTKLRGVKNLDAAKAIQKQIKIIQRSTNEDLFKKNLQQLDAMCK